MTSLIEVSTHLPARVTLGERQPDLGLSEKEMLRYTHAFGLSEIAWERGGSDTENLMAAVEKLTRLRGSEEHVRLVLRPLTVRFPPPYPRSAVRAVCEAVGLRHARAFTVTEQACAGGIGAVDVAAALLEGESDPEAMALVLVGEKAQSRVQQNFPAMGLTGEGVAAVLVGRGGATDRILGYSCITEPVDHKLVMAEEASRRFGKLYGDAVCAVVDEAIAKAGCVHDDIALLLPHNLNRISWVKLSSRLGIPLDRLFLDNISRTGHCFGADPFINLRTALDLGRLQSGDRYVMLAVGIGATFTAMVLEH
jgi:3-oxoacyl-[acyl-carrier-protein] synthase III